MLIEKEAQHEGEKKRKEKKRKENGDQVEIVESIISICIQTEYNMDLDYYG